MSAWIRWNIRSGFNCLTFDRCRLYWNFPATAIKPHQIYTHQEEIFLQSITENLDERQRLRLKHTVLRQWMISVNKPISDCSRFPRINIESQSHNFSFSWKFCVICAKQERSHLGYSYWHKNHQLSSAGLCDLHDTPLYYSHDTRRINHLILPHHFLHNNKYLLMHTEQWKDLDWNQFIRNIDYIMEHRPDHINVLKSALMNELGIPDPVRPKHRELIKEISRTMEGEIDPNLVNYICRRPQPGEKNRKEILSPLYLYAEQRKTLIQPSSWLIALYWLRNKNNAYQKIFS